MRFNELHCSRPRPDHYYINKLVTTFLSDRPEIPNSLENLSRPAREGGHQINHFFFLTTNEKSEHTSVSYTRNKAWHVKNKRHRAFYF